MRDSAIYACAGVFSQAIAFILFPLLAHRLDPEQYGVIDIVGVLTTLMLLTVALEINQGLARMVADGGEAAHRSAYASTALIWSVASYGVLLLVGLALAGPITHALLGPRVNVEVTQVALCGVVVAGTLYVVQDQLRWSARPLAFALVSIVVAVASAIAVAVYVFALGGGALGVVAGQLTGSTAGLLAAFAMSRGVYRLRFDRDKARTMLAFSVPLVPSSIGVLLNGYGDRLALQHEESLAAVGVYGVGFRISVAVTLLLTGVQGAATPLVLARHAEPSTPYELAKIFRWFWAAGCVAFIFLSVLAEPLVRLLSGPAYYAAARVVPLLVGATFLAGLYVFAPGPTIAGRTRLYALINIVAGFLNLGLAFALVPGSGVVGAGMATAFSSLFAFIAWMLLSQRFYPVPHDWRGLAVAGVIAVVAVIASRQLVVTGRGDAIGISSLLGRLAFCSVGSVAVGYTLLDAREVRRVIARARASRAAGQSRGSPPR